MWRQALRVSGTCGPTSGGPGRSAGEVGNLVSADGEHLEELTTYLYQLWSAPLQLTLALGLLYWLLGPPLLAGQSDTHDT